MDSIQPQEFLLLIPEMVLAVSGMLLLLSGALKTTNGYRFCVAATLAALAGTAVLLVTVQGVPDAPRVILSGMFIVDGYSFFFKLLLLMGRIDEAAEAARETYQLATRAGDVQETTEAASAVAMTLLAEGHLLIEDVDQVVRPTKCD